MFGGAELVLCGLEKQTFGIDFIVSNRKQFAQLQNILNSGERCPISYRRNGVEYTIGLPHDFPILTRPYIKEVKMIGNIRVNNRPLRSIAHDYETFLKEKEAVAARINEPPSILNDFPLYVKYKTRVERLRKVLSA